jgi:steroid delta-isomerase-like uncharacterized protein
VRAMNGAELQGFIDRYNAAWNDHDIDAILEMHADDSVFENHTTGDLNVGKDAIGNAIRGIFTVFPDLTFETRRQYIRDGLVVQEWTARGTHLGKMSRAGLEVEPTGRTVRRCHTAPPARPDADLARLHCFNCARGRSSVG